MSLPVVYYGSVVNPVSLKSFKALGACLIAVSSTGNIDWIVEDVHDSMVQETMGAHGYLDVEVVCLQDGEFLIPGFIDTHTHAPQVPNIGSGQSYELLEWLERITFPTESMFQDPDFARRTYTSVVRRIIDSGTTTCCYYGTIHLEATQVLFSNYLILHADYYLGQRAFIGKCNMDRNSPSYYIEPSVEVSMAATKALISHIKQLPSNPHAAEPLVQPILTPRFAITCTSPLLSSLGQLAASDPNLRIQTHISENLAEVTFTKSLFPECSSYAGAYDSFGLLRANTILAHAVHLSDDEITLIAKKKSGISHCPTSNFNLSSGVAPIGKYLDHGIKVGLGTDVSGGYSPSILNAIQNASIASKVIAMQTRGNPDASAEFSNKQLSVASLLYLATSGGAEVCDLENSVGSFSVGKSFDALQVNVRNNAGNPAMWGSDSGPRSLEGMLEQFLFCGDDRNISRVYVQGKLIGGTATR
ncbi:Metallo-dependent hydrolase [Mycena maculata]|uniref:Guanine deaminase n=1 Tax=Mycena maculata TaxID=230809 RepID=A0AAD7IF03_9AGAR|nr:Metallo-dependent hydrolase [Mycena maculata]